LVSHIEGGTKAEGVRKWHAGEILGHKRDEVAGEFRRLHNVELCDLYSSTTLFGGSKQRNEMGGTSSI